MYRWRRLNIEAEGTGISEPLSIQVNLLGAMLGQLIRRQAGQETFERVEELRMLCKQAAREKKPEMREQAETKIGALDLGEIFWLLRAYTTFFHLINQAERQEIVRVNRERARAADPVHPRPESIDEIIHDLKEQDHSLKQVLDLLSNLDIQPTLTAHPTEARRRTILFKQQRIAALLAELQRSDLIPEEEEAALDDLCNQIAILLVTDDVRAERPSVADEVKQGVYFLRDTIWDTVPRIYRDLQRALRQYYGETADIPAFIRYRSWIGSDRDGNPNVTAEVTRWTAALQRRTALELYLEELAALRRELSLSERQTAIPEDLYESLAEDAEVLDVDGERGTRFQHEPYRQKLNFMTTCLERLLEQTTERSGYDADRFLKDLQLIERCLRESGFEDVARHGRLGRLLVLVRTFGFHLAALDIRQHSRVHRETVAALLKTAGVTEDYAGLPEEKRREVLTAELTNPRPLLAPGTSLPDRAQKTLETFQVMRELLEWDSRMLGSYVVSMTHTVSDLLEVLLLAKEVGLWRWQDGKASCPFDVVPLFETIEDLDEAGDRLEALFAHPVYRRQIEARDNFQEIMLGYSDSNKDGGYWMANWALHKAQARIGEVCRTHGIDFRLFHGRGGTVERGGGRTHKAILSMPAVVHNGRMRFTEQGEVISFRYALPAIARRHMEQIVGTVLRATARTAAGAEDEPLDPEDARLMEHIAKGTFKAYRRLIDDEDFWNWYTQVTPIEQISRLPIASRPVSRGSASEVDFEDLRAIPWVFSWTQTRYAVPGWFGIGRILEDILSDDKGDETLRRLYKRWPFFATIANNAQREMARARLEISHRYSRLTKDDERFHELINEDFRRTRQAILRIVEQDELLGHNPVIQKSIALRNPYADVLHLLQIELLKRYRKAAEGERGSLREALFLSINGIAAAMQSTG